jgi:hypothetical protein
MKANVIPSIHDAPRSHRFTPDSRDRMEEVFAISPTPCRAVRLALAADLQCTERQVQIWLQNKRQRNKRKERRGASEDDHLPLPSASADAYSRTGEGVVRPGANMEIFLEGVAPHRGKRAC